MGVAIKPKHSKTIKSTIKIIMELLQQLTQGVISGVHSLYGETPDAKKVNLSVTRKEFEGDYTVVVFPFTKLAKKKPEQIGAELGQYMVDQLPFVSDFNVIKGFLNLSVEDSYWTNFLHGIAANKDFGKHPSNGRKIMVEFSSPNTCLLYTSPSPRDRTRSRMPSSA